MNIAIAFKEMSEEIAYLKEDNDNLSADVCHLEDVLKVAVLEEKHLRAEIEYLRSQEFDDAPF
jgi:dGTP triphosphohydrolase